MNNSHLFSQSITNYKSKYLKLSKTIDKISGKHTLQNKMSEAEKTHKVCKVSNE